MKTINLFLVILLLFVFVDNSLSQQQWSLKQCVDYALEHNIQVKQSELQVKSNKSSLQQSKAGVLPDVNAQASEDFHFGRSVDPFTNQFTENNIESFNVSVTGSITIFKGLQQYHSIRQDNYALMSSMEGVEKMKNDISLMVASSYLQIIFDQELLEVAKQQVEITKEQENRTKILVNAGSLPKGRLLEIQAQLATEEYSVVNSENNLKTSYLNLAQLLELENADSFKIQLPELPEPTEGIVLQSVNDIYEKSLELPRIKMQEYSLKSSESALSFSRGGLSPSLSLYASYGTGYSSARSLYTQEIGTPMPIGYVGSTMEQVLAPTINNIENDYPYGDQLKDNMSFRIGVSLRIPIFNKFMVKNSISQSKIQVENTEYQLEVSKNELLKDIQSARNSAQAALSRYNASKKAVEAQEESFSYTKQRFELGLINTVDYNAAKNQLTKSKSDMLQAKYEFYFRINVLNFYQGVPFQL